MADVSELPGTAETAARVLHPHEPSAFLRDHYARRALHLRTDDQGRFAPLLTLDELESYMRAPGFFERVNVALRRPESYESITAADTATVFERVSRGDALQVVGLDRVLPDRHPVIRIFRALEQLCGAPAKGITVFLVPPGTSLPKHHDGYEIFTLQLAGTKRWLLYDFVAPSHEQEAYAALGEPLEVCDLGPGDFLYTPKSQVHHVLAGDSLSMSIALVFQPPSWLALVDALLATVEQDRGFWSSLPATGLETGFEARRQALIEALGRLDPAAFARRIETERRMAIPGLPSGHLEECYKIDTLTPRTLMRLRPGPAPMVSLVGEVAILVSPHCEPIGAPLQAAPALRFIAAATRAFRIGEICDRMDDDSKLALVRKLARRGVVQTAPDASP